MARRRKKLPPEESSYLEGRLAEYRRNNGDARASVVTSCAKKLLDMRGVQEEGTAMYTLLLDQFEDVSIYLVVLSRWCAATLMHDPDS